VNIKTVLASILVLVAVSASAQMASKPSPEANKLAYFVGSWTTDGAIAQGPWGAGGKFSASGSTEWMPGNFFIVGHSDFKMPAELGGDGQSTIFMGFDTERNVYTYDAFSSQGRRETAKGTLAADAWTWTSSQTYGGQEIQQRRTIKILSPTSYTMKFEVSMDGVDWMPFMDCKATKK
jgi:Protein of unknown function (DUF1579)